MCQKSILKIIYSSYLQLVLLYFISLNKYCLICFKCELPIEILPRPCRDQNGNRLMIFEGLEVLNRRHLIEGLHLCGEREMRITLVGVLLFTLCCLMCVIQNGM